MFFPAKMCKVRVIGLKSNIGKTIGALERYGGAEIKKFSNTEISLSKPLETHDETIEMLLKMEALLNALNGKATYAAKIPAAKAAEYIKSKEFRETEKEIMKISAELESNSAELDVQKDAKARLSVFLGFDIDFGKLKLSSVSLIAGTVAAQKRPAVESALSKISEANSFACIVALKKGNEEAIEEISRAGFERVQLPEIGTKPSSELRAIEKRIAELEKNKAALQKELLGISAKSYQKLAAAKEYLEIESGKSGAATSLGSTQHVFVLEAYLPEKNYREFERFAHENFGERMELRKFSSHDLESAHEEAPTLLEHNKALAPFEFITKYMAVPRSGELDPTIIFLVFFPIFYGMMVGDFVYGLISFLLARFIVKKVGAESILKPVGIIWMRGAIPSIIFGIIYDEFMGMSHTELIHRFFGLEEVVLYHGIERLHNVQFLLAATILIGIITVCTGFLLGFLNAAKHGNKKHAIAKFGWFGTVIFGTVLISTAIFNSFPQIMIPASGLLLLVSLSLVVKGEGAVGLIELPSIVGNVLSFSRILAVGLVGTLIALILNDLLFPSLDKGILLIILIPVYIVGHLFNAFLAMFESFIQGARLNFVEMNSKFFEGGGREFAPFRLSRKYIKDD